MLHFSLPLVHIEYVKMCITALWSSIRTILFFETHTLLRNSHSCSIHYYSNRKFANISTCYKTHSIKFVQVTRIRNNDYTTALSLDFLVEWSFLHSLCFWYEQRSEIAVRKEPLTIGGVEDYGNYSQEFHLLSIQLDPAPTLSTTGKRGTPCTPDLGEGFLS